MGGRSTPLSVLSMRRPLFYADLFANSIMIWFYSGVYLKGLYQNSVVLVDGERSRREETIDKPSTSALHGGVLHGGALHGRALHGGCGSFFKILT